MNEKTYTTSLGVIHYWIHIISTVDLTLVFSARPDGGSQAV